MKKGLFIVLFAMFAMSNVNAQFSVGGGATLFNGGTALELRGNYTVAEKISIVPYFDYFLSTGSDYSAYTNVKVSTMMYGVDGHYSLGDPEALDFYPILGLNIYSSSVSAEGYNYSFSHTGLDFGGGLTYALSDSMKLFGEGRYMSHGLASAFGISAGLLFSF